MKYLIIVESPSKCNKIQKYLNDNDDFNIYEVVATMGHITELKSLENIDIENNFECQYDIMESKKKAISNIKKKIKSVDEVILACDNDREGEGICFFICKVFKLNVKTTKRIIFNEVTEKAILEAIKNPVFINIDLVQAQQTRQILDLLIGYTISPILWKYIDTNKNKISLSAGRCQTPALRIINDNYNNINQHSGQIMYKIIGYFTNMNLAFELNRKISQETEVVDFLEKSSIFDHKLCIDKPIKKIYPPPKPLITSSLQQICSNELHISPNETMKICQDLYENGYITYMRTDTKNYSKDFIEKAYKFIENNYEKKYNNYDFIKKDIKVGAHEAIRPTYISLDNLPEPFNNIYKRVYKIIYVNTLESLLLPASYFVIRAKINSIYNDENIFYEYFTEVIDFPGWKIIKKNYSLENKEFNYLKNYKSSEIVKYSKIIASPDMYDLKLHYTEARLVQLLEEYGIGRPSTFSSIVEKIQEREYVKKQDIHGTTQDTFTYELENHNINKINKKITFGNEKNKLVIQPLGISVINFLEDNFELLFNYNYTKQMEDNLDLISLGEKTKKDVCKTAYNEMMILVDKINSEMIPKTKTVNNVDTSKLLKPTPTNISQYGKNGILLGKYDNEDLFLKKGKFGLYVVWGQNKKSMNYFGNRPIENIRLEEIISKL
jgi:DNA topoisomerase-1